MLLPRLRMIYGVLPFFTLILFSKVTAYISNRSESRRHERDRGKRYKRKREERKTHPLVRFLTVRMITSNDKMDIENY